MSLTSRSLNSGPRACLVFLPIPLVTFTFSQFQAAPSQFQVCLEIVCSEMHLGVPGEPAFMPPVSNFQLLFLQAILLGQLALASYRCSL